MKSAVKVVNLNKNYYVHKNIIKVFKNLNLNFYYGKMYGIIGHSGCGKSTLIKIIGLLENYDSGNIFINNTDISKTSLNDQAKLRNEKIGFVFQDYLLDDYLNVYDNILLPTLLNKKDNKNNIIDLAKTYGIENRLKHFPKELSGGEQARVALIRAIINDPDIILADEPTGNLDGKNEIIVLNNLKKIARNGKCVIVVSHSKDIEKYVDEIIDLEGEL